MKKSMIAATLAIALAAVAAPFVHAATQTFTGTISDSMCGKKHMMPGMSDAKCVEECVKAGAKYVLVVGDKVYTLSAKPGAITPFAGKKVQVQGELKNDTIAVTAIR